MPPEEKIIKDSERLVRVETELAHLKDNFDEIKTALLQLAKDMHTLAVSDAERKEDRRTFERIFTVQNEIREELVRLWKRTDDIISAREVAAKERLEAEIRRHGDEKKRKGQWAWDVAKMIGAAFLALVAHHYGA